MLAFLTFIPFVGTLITILHRKDDHRGITITGMVISCAILIVALFLPSGFHGDFSTMKFVIRHDWIQIIGAEFHMGIDGISLWMVILTAFLTPLCILFSSGSIKGGYREFIAMLFLMETAMIGVFVSLDLLLFFIFWEMMLIPMYFLIGAWGSDRRIYSAMKFFLYTMFGSILMLVAILVIHNAGFEIGMRTFNLMDYPQIARKALSPIMSSILFWFFFVAFAIKVPLFPFHTWLPDAHTDAPTAGSVILAGVLLKVGTYGLLRFNLMIFPKESVEFALFISVLAVIGIIYGAWVATIQPDMKRLIAYSSISHLGFVVLGIFTFDLSGMTGGVLQMLNHGLSTSALFFIAGIIYDRTHTKLIDRFGGLARKMPFFAACFMCVMLASIGLPGLNGFVGEFLVLVGSSKAAFNELFTGANIAITILAVSGVLWTAIYMLWMYQRVMLGPITHDENKHLTDLDRREKWILVPIVALCFIIGIYPKPFIAPIQMPVKRIIEYVQEQNSMAALEIENFHIDGSIAMGGDDNS